MASDDNAPASAPPRHDLFATFALAEYSEPANIQIAFSHKLKQ